jgi:hypothetical protein
VAAGASSFEALDGMLLMGFSTALLFAIIQRIGRIAHTEIWEESVQKEQLMRWSINLER